MIAPAQAAESIISKSNNAEPLQSGEHLLKVVDVKQGSYNALRSALKAQAVWNSHSTAPRCSSSLAACHHLIHQIDGQRRQVAQGLKQAKDDITSLYESLMENDGIKSSMVGEASDPLGDDDQGLRASKEFFTLPPKVKNNMHFNIVKLRDYQKATGDQGQASVGQGESKQPGRGLWPETAQSGQNPSQPPNSDEMSKHN